MVFYCRCFSILTLLQIDTSTRPSNSADNYQTANSTFELRGGRGSTSNPQNGSRTTQDGATRPVVPNKNLRVFKLAELKKATNNFNDSCMIGEGGYGKVHKGMVKSLEDPNKNIEVAVKRGKRGQKGYRQWETEVNVLGDDMLQHPNLVKLIGYCNEDNDNESNWLLVYEFMPNGSLDDHLSGKLPPPSWVNRLKIAKDAATGLKYLHEGMDKQIVFRDFKPPNILLDNEWNAKLSDFGFARDGPQDGRTHVSTAVVGTKGYAAPEYVQTGRMTYKIDVWSYGIFLEELITGKRPVAQKNSERNPQFLRWVCCYTAGDEKSIIVDPRLVYSEKSMEKLISIAKKCLAKEQRSRPKMSEVLEMVEEAIALQDADI